MIGMSCGNLANFATFRVCNLAGDSLFQVFFAAFFMLARLYYSAKNEKNLKDQLSKVCDLARDCSYIYRAVGLQAGVEIFVSSRPEL